VNEHCVFAGHENPVRQKGNCGDRLSSASQTVHHVGFWLFRVLLKWLKSWC
jgi:hypothetical protein